MTNQIRTSAPSASLPAQSQIPNPTPPRPGGTKWNDAKRLEIDRINTIDRGSTPNPVHPVHPRQKAGLVEHFGTAWNVWRWSVVRSLCNGPRTKSNTLQRFAAFRKRFVGRRSCRCNEVQSLAIFSFAAQPGATSRNGAQRCAGSRFRGAGAERAVIVPCRSRPGR